MLSQDSTEEATSHRSGETWSGSWLLQQLHSRLKQVSVLLRVYLYLQYKTAWQKEIPLSQGPYGYQLRC